MKKAKNPSGHKGSRNRKTWEYNSAETDRAEEKYDFSASWREPKGVQAFLRTAENQAARREERRQACQRTLTCAGLAATAVVLLVVSAFVPGDTTASPNMQNAASFSVYPAAEVFAEGQSSRKDWCYTFLILQRDEEAENLEAATVGMLDRKEKTLSLVSVPPKLLVETGTGLQTLEAVYADKGAYGVRNQITRLLGYPVDHYISLSAETAAEIFRLLDNGTVFLPPLGEQRAAWLAMLENTLAAGCIRNRDGAISLLGEEGKTTLTEENLRWYAGELLKLDRGGLSVYALPTEAVGDKADALAVREEDWLLLLNQNFNPYSKTLTNENIRVTTAGA